MKKSNSLKGFLTIFVLLTTFYSANGISEIIISQSDVREHNLGLGKSVFLDKCSKCHTDIESEAPQLYSTYNWESRITTPVKTLIEHAINGHGKMPPRGGYERLTDREVSAAVAYIVDQSRRLIIKSNGNIALNQDDICTDVDTQKCTSMQVDNTMLLQLIWLMTNELQQN